MAQTLIRHEQIEDVFAFRASLGSLAVLNSVTQEYLPSSASFTNLYTTDIQTGGLAVTSTASIRLVRATNIIAGNAY